MIENTPTTKINESSNSMKPLDLAIQGNEMEFEEEIGLYRTYGGD